MIKIICIGKIKEDYLKQAVSDYCTRLSKYTRLELIELPDEALKDKVKCIELEGANILNHIKERDYVITLEIDGPQYTSTEFASYLSQAELSGNLTFIIGGSYGLSAAVKMRSNKKISFSKKASTSSEKAMFVSNVILTSPSE